MGVDTKPLMVIAGERELTIEDVLAVADGKAGLRLSEAEGFEAGIEAGANALAGRIEAGEKIYGVNTGFGESCLNDVDAHNIADLPLNLVRFHGCGTGRFLSSEESAAVLVVRLASLVRGWSGVRPRLLQKLCALIEHRIFPRIPSEGSVGASGDLTPLSYVAAVLMGDREVEWKGKVLPASEALAKAGIEKMRLQPKESLAIMNGTSVMTALLCVAHRKAERLLRLSATLTAMASDVMRGNPSHFDERINRAKPHPGQLRFAQWVCEHLEYDPGQHRHDGRIQDRYSVRCAPQVGGVLLDALTWMRSWIEIELNGANDNPLIDPETGDALHGGNFYGGHACFVADGLKNAVANMADLLDRQLALLCAAGTNGGLPENLVGREGDDKAAHHGFKAMQITVSALTAEALKLTMPASVFSRSTECHNQDKVSMGTIAARDSLRVLELTETVAAIHLLALVQAVDLRERQGGTCRPRSRALREQIRRDIPFNDGDRRQDGDIQRVLELLREDALPIGGDAEGESGFR